jgi:hypothetical protein
VQGANLPQRRMGDVGIRPGYELGQFLTHRIRVARGSPELTQSAIATPSLLRQPRRPRLDLGWTKEQGTTLTGNEGRPACDSPPLKSTKSSYNLNIR